MSFWAIVVNCMKTCLEQVESTDQNGDVSSAASTVIVHSVRYLDDV